MSTTSYIDLTQPITAIVNDGAGICMAAIGINGCGAGYLDASDLRGMLDAGEFGLAGEWQPGELDQNVARREYELAGMDPTEVDSSLLAFEHWDMTDDGFVVGTGQRIYVYTLAAD